MSTEVIVALIAFGSVVISVVISIFTSSRQTTNELNKLRTEIQQLYANKLLERRLETYPEIYNLLSELAKKLESRNFTKDDLSNLHKEINALDSKSSILFSGHTSSIAARFRKYFTKLLQQDDESFKPLETLKEIKNQVGEFELALKSDLGIYVVEFADPSKRFLSYAGLFNAVDEDEKRKSAKPRRK